MKHPTAPKKKPFQALVAFSRAVHIYLTMLGLFVMLLFGITGFTIDHEDWFGATQPKVDDATGTTPAQLIAGGDRLAVVESLRTTFKISGAVTAYDNFDDEISVGFKEPGQIWEVRITKARGATSVHHETFNFAAVINNLHRGRYTGGAWRWVIDLSALLIVLACATGFILWLALPRRRQLGIAMLVLGTAITVAVAIYLVPGSDKGLAPIADSTPAVASR